jgi:2-C-methyl-D-erythritol 4-phosphate cytidylyltransferase
MGGSIPKQFILLGGKPILVHTLNTLAGQPSISTIFLVVAEGHIPDAAKVVSEWSRQPGSKGRTKAVPEISIVAGGAERMHSVYNGLRKLPVGCDWVMIHDAVRPFASARLIEAAREGARSTGACIAAIPATDTVKRGHDSVVLETLSRDEIWLVQTPQVFRKQIVVEAYEKAFAEGWTGTDDASFVERIGIPVAIVHGERTNIKVTTPEDLAWAEWFLSARIGSGRP